MQNRKFMVDRKIHGCFRLTNHIPGHSCPQQRLMDERAWDEVKMCPRSRLAADRNVRPGGSSEMHPMHPLPSSLLLSRSSVQVGWLCAGLVRHCLTMSSALPLNSIPTPAQPTAPPRRKGTLLVVDDEEGPRESLRVIFKDDYEMLMAGDGAT